MVSPVSFKQLSAASFAPTRFGEKPAVSQPEQSPHQDSFQPSFAQQGLTEEERLQKTIAMAKELLKPGLTNSEMAQAVQQALALQGKNLTIFDGNLPEMTWVDKAVQLEGCEAFHHIPESLMFGGPRPDQNWGNLDEPYRKALQSLYTEKSLGIFIPKGASRGTVMHELFHALQYANGLPSHTGSAADFEIAMKHKSKLSEGLLSGSGWFSHSVNTAWGSLKRVGYLLFVAPFVWLRHSYQKEPPKTGPGATLRALMVREKEASAFIVKEGLSRGATIKNVIDQGLYYVAEGWLQTIRSYALDPTSK